MNAQSKAEKVLDILEKDYPDARVTLNFQDPLQLLMAAILAAQCTDERVNRVTKDLFRKYRNATDFAQADIETLEEEIRPTGFYHNKAKNIIRCCQMIMQQFQGQIPRTLQDLTALPGVGRKTANIILVNVYGQQAIAVDTHVKRVTHRLGWAEADDPDNIEFQLMAVIPPNRWTLACHQLVFHGREICSAQKPKCNTCSVAVLCPQIGAHPIGKRRKHVPEAV